jgi:hypothetical protein
MRRLRIVAILLMAIIAGCEQGAVVFAPTPLPPDLVSVRYTHPSGAFSIDLPRNWTVSTQNTNTLASAFFTPPTGVAPTLGVYAIHLIDQPGVTTIIDDYQQLIRPDAARYGEQDRQVMSDGSWRLTGLRVSPGGVSQQINTFIQLSGEYLGVVDAELPDTPDRQAQLERIINSFSLNASADLEPTPLTTLANVAPSQLEILHVSSWGTSSGVYFVTGEVINHSDHFLINVPVRVELQTADGVGLAEALDMVMGYAIPPGEFAPFSLRFGQGQPDNAVQYALTLGAADWTPETANDEIISEVETLTWTDTSSFTPEGHLLISGALTNTGTESVRDPLATVTVFDSRQNVIAAVFSLVTDASLAPQESIDFNIQIAEMGGDPSNYIVNIQARPDS